MAIKVNADQWNSLTPQQQAQITEGLKARGGLKFGTIVADPSVPPHSDQAPPTPTGPMIEGGNPECAAGCLQVYEMEVSYCASLGGGAPAAICYAAIMTEYGACLAWCMTES